MSDSKKTKKQLLAELDAMRDELNGLKTSENDEPKPRLFSDDGITRREAVAAWVAPVILSIPLIARPAGAQDLDPAANSLLGAPTTVNPTTMNPTTMNPTTMNPTTMNPTTMNPTTQNPTTMNPTTMNPTTQNPTTMNPTTMSPTTMSPTFVSPTTMIPTASPTAIPTSFPTQTPTAAPTTTVIFQDGFETGDTTRWSNAVTKKSEGKKARPRGRELVDSGFPSPKTPSSGNDKR